MTHREDNAIRLTAALWAEREWSRRMTSADRKAMEAWLDADERHAIEFELAKQLLGSDALTGALASAARDYNVRAARTPKKRFWLQPVWVGTSMMAAAAAVVFCVTTIMASSVESADPVEQFAAAIQLVTPAGQGRTELLPDGSRIDLNGGTRLTTTFSSVERSIELASGDVAFQVAPDAKRPFVVSTQHLSATALGTAFTVSHFESHSIVRVTEHEVRVASRMRPGQSVVARPGDSVDVDASGAIRLTHDKETADDWRAGWVDTQAMTIADLAAAMQRRTGHAVTVTPAVKALNVSGRFRIDEPEAVLRRLALLHNLRVIKTRDGFALAAASPG